MSVFSVVQEAARKTNSVIVAFSGGKDSIVALDLCSKYFERIAAYFLYTVPNLEFQQSYIKYVESRYSIDIVQLPHFSVSYYLRNGVCCVARDVPEITIADIHAEARARTSIEWIATGEKMQDSLQRRGMINKCKGIDEKRHIFYPLAFFTTRSIFSYMKINKLLLPSFYKTTDGSFGDLSDAKLLGAIKTNWPDDYAKIEDIFPFVEAVVKRAEFGEAQSAKV